jgi:hypothetical protein
MHQIGGPVVGTFTRNHRKLGGRARGTPNRRTVHGREFAERLCNDAEYLANLEARAKAGRLPPGVEILLWHYAHGRPKEVLELSGSIGTRDVATMSTEELLAELEQHQRTTALLLTEHHGQRHSQGD